jgi:hypothetical protein
MILPILKHKEGFMTKMTIFSIFSGGRLYLYYGPPPRFWRIFVLLDYSFPFSALFSYQYISLFSFTALHGCLVRGLFWTGWEGPPITLGVMGKIGVIGGHLNNEMSDGKWVVSNFIVYY